MLSLMVYRHLEPWELGAFLRVMALHGTGVRMTRIHEARMVHAFEG